MTLSSGDVLRGCFFLAGSTAAQSGGERVVDLLNSENGFFPFEAAGRTSTVLINREHLVAVRLTDGSDEVRLDSGYDVALVRRVVMKLSNRLVLHGCVRLYLPEERSRLSDYARAPIAFRYLETADGTFVVNTAHIVELSEIEE